MGWFDPVCWIFIRETVEIIMSIKCLMNTACWSSNSNFWFMPSWCHGGRAPLCFLVMFRYSQHHKYVAVEPDDTVIWSAAGFLIFYFYRANIFVTLSDAG